jgi:SAM-dependent methyltransferase
MEDTSLPPISEGRIKFDPPLGLQRQTAILKAIEAAKPRSVLDIGCGEGNLLACLVRVANPHPIQILVGLDTDHRSVIRANEFVRMSAENQTKTGRWSDLIFTLLEGSFSKIKLRIGSFVDINEFWSLSFDLVVSSEVIEHLDPPELAKYWKIHLDVLRPKHLIVTTPNRDFNAIFRASEAVTGESKFFMKDGVDYPMRHEDHKFEYTRQEFEKE